MKFIQNSGIAQLSMAVLFCALVFQITEGTIPNLQALPISGLENTHQNRIVATGDELRNLFPLVAVNTEKPVPAAPSEVISVDEAFIPANKVMEIEKKQVDINKTPDYFPLLDTGKVLELQAITNDGAIINQRYYAYNTALWEFAYPVSPTKSATPVLRKSKEANSVRIAENPGKRNFILKLDDK